MKIVITVDGGTIVDVALTEPAEVIIVDKDIDGLDPTELIVAFGGGSAYKYLGEVDHLDDGTMFNFYDGQESEDSANLRAEERADFRLREERGD